MKLMPTPIEGLFVAETDLLSDYRGNFSRLFCERDLAGAIGNRKIVQINRSLTITPGTVRGMHYQNPPYAETKLVRCTQGRILDVVIDIRAGSPTFLQWHAEELSPQNSRMSIIPEGFAHGFQALDHDSELLYLHTNFYKPEAEGGILYSDPRVVISWPLPVAHLTDRDQMYPLLPDDYCGIKV
jgi:dTDP-4-dehydrorhamnose 3,5-epimerase